MGAGPGLSPAIKSGASAANTINISSRDGLSSGVATSRRAASAGRVWKINCCVSGPSDMASGNPEGEVGVLFWPGRLWLVATSMSCLFSGSDLNYIDKTFFVLYWLL